MSSHNEWDPLEEVIVGIVDGAMLPAWDTIYRAGVPPEQEDELTRLHQLLRNRPTPYPRRLVRKANRDLEHFVALLEAEGVTVRRPDPIDFSAPYSTPAWAIQNGFSAANPRDVLMVVGDELIEAPMVDRGRYFEVWAYRTLLKEYFQAGARWSAAPKPQLLDEQFDDDYRPPKSGEAMRYILTEFEPSFDAADAVRCGRDIFIQLSHATNEFGVSWLRRHLGDDYRVHVVESKSPQALHIDTTLVPLAPGKVMINPQYLGADNLPEYFRDWDLLVAPPADTADRRLLDVEMMSDWVNMNVLSLDQERVIVEKSQSAMIQALKAWGFTPIPCPFEAYYPFVGSFHCATLDVRRRGELQSYA